MPYDDKYLGLEMPPLVPPPTKSKGWKKRVREEKKAEAEKKKQKKEALEKLDKPKYRSIHIRFSSPDYYEAMQRKIFYDNEDETMTDIVLRALHERYDLEESKEGRRKKTGRKEWMNIGGISRELSDALSKEIQQEQNERNLKSGVWLSDIVEDALEEYLANELADIRKGIGRR